MASFLLSLMNTTQQNKIEVHGRGAGGVTKTQIEMRAREIALIQARDSREPTEADRAEARAELTGETITPTMTDDGQSLGTLSRDPSQGATVTGRQTPVVQDPDEQEGLERLALDGVEEAQHEQMLESRRADRRPA